MDTLTMAHSKYCDDVLAHVACPPHAQVAVQTTFQARLDVSPSCGIGIIWCINDAG